ncbi:MAG TPA: glycosyltransferase family 61 protein, partial [Pyrinomonadaceae bacterium]
MSSPTPHAPTEIELLPQRSSTCRLPLNLREDDLPLFSHELKTTLPPARLIEMHDVSISSDGYLFQGMRILAESFAFPFLQDNWKKRSVWKFLAVNYMSRRRRPLEPDALFITDDWSTGYFHWLSDALPKLSLIRDRLKDLVLVLPHQLERLEFVRSSLKPFGVENVLFLKEQETVVCRKLFVATSVAPSGRYDQQVIRSVRDLIVNFYGGSASPKDLIYLSRSKAPKRRIANEDEVIALLQNYGFRVIHGEDCSFEQQVQIA